MTKFRIAILSAFSILSLTGMSAAAHGDVYGAIAYSPDTGAVGWSYNKRSRVQAEDSAMNNCLANADDCRVATYFRNACGAVARSPEGGWGADWGNSRREAENNALAECYNHGDNCRVIRWACTDH